MPFTHKHTRSLFFLPVFISLIFNFFFLIGRSQNLVPNPSFEVYDTCPISSASTTWNGPTGWSINVNSSDYFNVCANQASGVSVPYSAAGYQYASDGNGYCGFYGFVRTITTQQDAREYVGRQLSSPLLIGQKYYVTLKVSLANTSNCAINKLGILFFNNNYFSNAVFLQQPPPLINNFAHVYTDSLITDTLGWYIIKGSFMADSTYQYLLIGNFFDSANFDSILYTGNKCVAYYFVDEICLSADSLTCNPTLAIQEDYFENNVNIYPNPSNDKINISLSDKNKNALIKIYNLFGELIYQDKVSSSMINLSNHSAGVYIVKIQIENKIISQKLVLTN